MFSYQNLHFQYFQLCQRLTGRACHNVTLGGAEQLVFYQSSDGQLIFLAPWHHQKSWVSLLSAGVGAYIVYIIICIYIYVYCYIYICIYHVGGFLLQATWCGMIMPPKSLWLRLGAASHETAAGQLQAPMFFGACHAR